MAKKKSISGEVNVQADNEQSESQSVSDVSNVPLVEEKNDLIKSWVIVIKREIINEQIEQTLNGYTKQVKIPGFRQGKVPFDVVKNRFQSLAEEEVVNKLLEEQIVEHIRKGNMNVVHGPIIDEIEHTPNADVTAKVTVEIAPDFTLPDFSKLTCKIEKKGPWYEPFDEKKQIDIVLEANKRRTPVINRKISDGDIIVFKYQSRNIETTRMTPRKESNFEVTVGGSNEIIDLYKEVIGKNKGESFSVVRNYPMDYARTAWQGKTLEHLIEITQHFELIKPKMDEEFVKNSGYSDLQQFKDKLKEGYDVYQKKVQEENKIEQMIKMIVGNIDFPIPGSLVNKELSRLIQNPDRYAQDFNDDMLDSKKMFDRIKEDAEKNIRFSFIAEKIIKNHKIIVTQEDLDSEYQIVAQANSLDVKQVRKYYQNHQQLEQLKNVLEKRKVIDFLKENIIISEV